MTTRKKLLLTATGAMLLALAGCLEAPHTELVETEEVHLTQTTPGGAL